MKDYGTEIAWVSLHQSLPQRVPSKTLQADYPSAVFHPHWMRDTTFYLCMAPKSITNMNSLFEGLSYEERQPRIVSLTVKNRLNQDTIKYQLDPVLQKKWTSLDKLLDAIMEETPVLHMPIDVQFPFQPRSFKFTDSYVSRADAEKAASRARAAFYSKFAFVSFAARQRQLTPSNCDESRLNLPSEVIAIMQNSCICMPVPRVGGFIDAFDTSEVVTWPRYLSWLADAQDVPLWINYGPEAQMAQSVQLFSHKMPPLVKKLTPTPDALAQARARSQGVVSHPPAATWETVAPSSNSPWGDIGTWGTGDVQLTGRSLELMRQHSTALKPKPQHPSEYFALQAERRAQKIAQESESERLQREEVERRNAERPTPLAAHPVFEWVVPRLHDIDEEEVWERCIVGRRKVNALWLRTAPSQRRFHYFNHASWDVWEGLDPDAIISDEDDDAWHDVYPLPDHPLAANATSESTSRPSPPADRGRSRSRSRSRSHRRSRSPPPRRRHSRSRSPPRRRYSRSRSPPRRRRSRSRSPRPRRRSRSRSPHARHQERSVRRDDDRHRPPQSVNPPRIPPPSAPARAQQRQGPRDWSQLVRDFLGEVSPDRPHRVVDPIMWVLQNRYGFTPSSSYSTDPNKTARRLDAKAVAIILSCSIESDPIPTEGADATLDFVGHLISGISPPLGLCDLVVDSPLQYLKTRLCPIQVEGMIVGTDAARTEEGELPSEQLRTVYALKPRGLPEAEDFPWLLIVESAATAAQAIRCQWGPHKVRVIEQLVERGIPFKLLRQNGGTPAIPRAPVGGSGLGGRSWEFKATSAEYIVYERVRDSFLVNNAHARAALSSGGIVWRLSIDCLQVQSAFRGPTTQPEHQACLKLNGTVYAYDTLSPNEEDIICGVYKVFARKY